MADDDNVRLSDLLMEAENEPEAAQSTAENQASEGEPAAAQEPGEPEPEAQGAVGEGEEPSGEGEGEPEAPCESPFICYLREQFGEEVVQQLLSKYRSDHEIVKGLLNAYSLVGRQDAEAQAFRALRERLGDEKIVQILSGKPAPPEAQAAVGSAVMQPTPEEEEEGLDYDPGWFVDKVYVDPETGKFIPGPGGTEEDVRNFEKFLKHREKFLSEFAAKPKTFLRDIVREQVTAAINQAKDEVAVTLKDALQNIQGVSRTYSALASFLDTHADELFLDGDPAKGMTPLAKRMMELNEQLFKRGFVDDVERASVSLELARNELRNTARPLRAPPKTAAKRAPSASPSKRPSVEELIEKGYSLRQALAEGEE